MGWRKVKLGEVLSLNRDRVAILPGTTYRQITVRLWGKGLTLRKELDGVEIKADRQVSVNAGELLISKIDARHGAFGIVPPELEGAVVSNDFPSFKIDRSILLPDFLEWFSKTTTFVELCKKASSGSTNRKRLKEAQFLDLEVPLPPLNEQVEIVAQLNRVQSQLDKRRTYLNQIDKDLRAMLLNAFSSAIEGAERWPLAKVAPLVRRPVEVSIDGEYPELGVRSFGKGTFHKPTLSGAEVGNKRLFEIHTGDLVFNIVFAWEGAIAVAHSKDKGRVGSHRFLTCVPIYDVADPEFLRFYLLTPEGIQQVGEASPGGAGRNRTLGIKKAERISVPIPDISVQRQFSKLCAQVARIREIRESTARDAAALIPAILHRYFEHELHVSDREMPKRRGNAPSTSNADGSLLQEPYGEAVLVGAIVKAFQDDGSQPVGNFRLQKSVYFARRHMGERALEQEFLRKAAGPYNPTMRYSGGIKIAEDKNWIVRAKGAHGEGSTLGDKSAEMDELIEKYGFDRSAAWVRDKFKFRKNEQWELLATVDYAKLALEASGGAATAAEILAYIRNDEEWAPKIKNLDLTKDTIQNALIELQSLMLD